MVARSCSDLRQAILVITEISSLMPDDVQYGVDFPNKLHANREGSFGD